MGCLVQGVLAMHSLKRRIARLVIDPISGNIGPVSSLSMHEKCRRAVRVARLLGIEPQKKLLSSRSIESRGKLDARTDGTVPVNSLKSIANRSSKEVVEEALNGCGRAPCSEFPDIDNLSRL
jgi:hypothetical protein